MKKLYYILILSLIILASCFNTPEAKIMRSIKNQGFLKSKILEVNIVDTIYEKDVIDTMIFDFARLDTLNQYIKNNLANKDSLFKNHDKFTRKEIDSLRKFMFEKTIKLERLRDFTKRRLFRMQEINIGDDDSIISGYWVLLRTEKDTIEYAVKSNFELLAPKFILQYHERPRNQFNNKNIIHVRKHVSDTISKRRF